MSDGIVPWRKLKQREKQALLGLGVGVRLQMLIRVLGKVLLYLSKDLKKGTRYALMIARGRILQAEQTADAKA